MEASTPTAASLSSWTTTGGLARRRQTAASARGIDSHSSATPGPLLCGDAADFRVIEREQKSRASRRQRRSSSSGELRRRKPAVVCQQPPVVWSTQFLDRQRSRRHGRPDYRDRGEAAVTAPRPRGAEVRPRERSALAGIQLAPAPPSRKSRASDRSVIALWQPPRRLVSQAARRREDGPVMVETS